VAWIEENATVATALLQSLIERGLQIHEKMLFVSDGGKGLRKSIRDTLGDAALVLDEFERSGQSAEEFARAIG
jgi:hypothetical protein